MNMWYTYNQIYRGTHHEHIMFVLLNKQYMSCYDVCITYHLVVGNSWGVDPVTSKGCVGCGPQEQFYGCSDIAIMSGNSTAQQWNVTSAPVDLHHTESTESVLPICEANGVYSMIPSMNGWCQHRCDGGTCVSSHCICH